MIRKTYGVGAGADAEPLLVLSSVRDMSPKRLSMSGKKSSLGKTSSLWASVLKKIVSSRAERFPKTLPPLSHTGTQETGFRRRTEQTHIHFPLRQIVSAFTWPFSSVVQSCVIKRKARHIPQTAAHASWWGEARRVAEEERAWESILFTHSYNKEKIYPYMVV
jgi:hypothetical protein